MLAGVQQHRPRLSNNLSIALFAPNVMNCCAPLSCRIIHTLSSAELYRLFKRFSYHVPQASVTNMSRITSTPSASFSAHQVLMHTSLGAKPAPLCAHSPRQVRYKMNVRFHQQRHCFDPGVVCIPRYLEQIWHAHERSFAARTCAPKDTGSLDLGCKSAAAGSMSTTMSCTYNAL